MKTPQTRKTALAALCCALCLLFTSTGCVTQTETVSYDPSLGPAYDVVNNPRQKKKKQGTFYSDDPGGAGAGPMSYYSN